ncbi:DUF3772 domain-containing protein [Corticimicrobacter populi]|uniref:DUF3772 domain-containing protein n=1 Tax=Corticimicrobacter populi TaxID=2175229 RepID=A0A2V1K6S0_9BURK|nr:DUF3772 domain-containing protein [Corticimicrobacter populi]PWF25175.1 DUF3772 domain-containing protein [Corticimicrobacter populi]
MPVSFLIADTSALRTAHRALSCLIVTFLLCLLPRFALAQDMDAAIGYDSLRQQFAELPADIDASLPDNDLLALRDRALAIRTEAVALSESLPGRIDGLQTRLTGLGEAGAEEPADLAAQRTQLQTQRAALQTQASLVNVLILDTDQVLEKIASIRRERFHAQLGQRTPSIVSGTLWHDLLQEKRPDLRRTQAILADIGTSIKATPIWIWAVILLWIGAILVLQTRLRKRLDRLSATRLPTRRLRRAAHAWMLTGLATLAPVLVLEGLNLGVSWYDPFSLPVRDAIQGFIGIVGFGGFAAGLGIALLSASKPAWRLPPLHDATAIALRPLPLIGALLIVLSWLIEQSAQWLGLGLTLTVWLNSILSLATALSAIYALLRLRKLRHQGIQPFQDDTDNTWLARVLFRWQHALAALTWAALIISVALLLIGYVALGSFILRQMIWVVVILSAAYLLSVTINDSTALLSERAAHAAQDDGDIQATRPAGSKQFIVLCSGILQLGIFILTVMLLLAPYGQGPLDLMRYFSQLRGSFQLGTIDIRPSLLLQGALVLLLGIAAVKAVQRWLAERLLPATRMDRGLQVSITTLAGYMGYIIALSVALSSIGISFERVTWIASALSVGIGFGLQAIVQNFVSGLIMLAERPVKVGDWVSLNGIEGDIKRINVRATEIQMGDRSTVIMPNSEFITKAVRNVTHEHAMGRVQFTLPLPLSVSPATVRTVLLEAFSQHPAILPAPAPAVTLEDINSSGNLVFKATGYVNSPRTASGARSAILFDVFERLAAAGIPLSSPASIVVSQAQPPEPTSHHE